MTSQATPDNLPIGSADKTAYLSSLNAALLKSEETLDVLLGKRIKLLGRYHYCQANQLVLEIGEVATNEGYSGEIRLLIGKTPQIANHPTTDDSIAHQSTIDILQVVAIAHRETPGLGDQIERNKSAWIEQFSHLSKGIALRQEGGQIDAIASATITSSAVINAVRAYQQMPLQSMNPCETRP